MEAPFVFQFDPRALPDSQLARETCELARELQPPFLFLHCVRSFVFADAIGRAQQKRCDRELLFVSVLLHDLGLATAEPLPDRFEVVGADLADRILQERGVAPERRAIAWDAIALHTSLSIAVRKGPEVELAALGIALDVAGGPLQRVVGRKAVMEIVERYPRLAFKAEIQKLMADVIRRNPRTIPLTFLADFAHTHVPEAKCPHLHEMIEASFFAE